MRFVAHAPVFAVLPFALLAPFSGMFSGPARADDCGTGGEARSARRVVVSR